ncbi:bifunctional adenosylcobinamide kinase/adenosylcobinamide-phosphate guanylyltransferase [Lacibacter sp.]|uniref:bifunctional adenosylcobinamide kinase/adenosylcobinamide-phosphate guanylyltransferase n=1 Tax=Lacibacter sp. TaxID=1915409 RepID=UPI002B4AF960|nr:bifunctional adenosylcobinamide kinase/adenosylcobinamide-phosphate guanylyltransferase [Lacibacter sp.]HLP39588.1 bifunctional adenosylcobinamide kinase/adenosylcobinamide-phosphate guanylyltransferase [Lacibacter sp.]
MIIFITGGARSGKSKYAQELALSLSDSPIYVATAKVWDDDFEKRVKRHQNDRDERWTNMEEQRNVSALPITNRICLIDCVTLWLTNFFVDTKNDVEASLALLKKEIDALCTKPGTFIIISNEIGMGVHADTEIGRKFTDLQGWANQYIAAKANEAVLMVSGIAVKIK